MWFRSPSLSLPSSSSTSSPRSLSSSPSRSPSRPLSQIYHSDSHPHSLSVSTITHRFLLLHRRGFSTSPPSLFSTYTSPRATVSPSSPTSTPPPPPPPAAAAASEPSMAPRPLELDACEKMLETAEGRTRLLFQFEMKRVIPPVAYDNPISVLDKLIEMEVELRPHSFVQLLSWASSLDCERRSSPSYTGKLLPRLPVTFHFTQSLIMTSMNALDRCKDVAGATRFLGILRSNVREAPGKTSQTDWMCPNDEVVNPNGFAKCRKCNKRREEVINPSMNSGQVTKLAFILFKGDQRSLALFARWAFEHVSLYKEVDSFRKLAIPLVKNLIRGGVAHHDVTLQWCQQVLLDAECPTSIVVELLSHFSRRKQAIPLEVIFRMAFTSEAKFSPLDMTVERAQIFFDGMQVNMKFVHESTPLKIYGLLLEYLEGMERPLIRTDALGLFEVQHKIIRYYACLNSPKHLELALFLSETFTSGQDLPRLIRNSIARVFHTNRYLDVTELVETIFGLHSNTEHKTNILTLNLLIAILFESDKPKEAVNVFQKFAAWDSVATLETFFALFYGLSRVKKWDPIFDRLLKFSATFVESSRDAKHLPETFRHSLRCYHNGFHEISVANDIFLAYREKLREKSLLLPLDSYADYYFYLTTVHNDLQKVAEKSDDAAGKASAASFKQIEIASFSERLIAIAVEDYGESAETHVKERRKIRETVNKENQKRWSYNRQARGLSKLVWGYKKGEDVPIIKNVATELDEAVKKANEQKRAKAAEFAKKKARLREEAQAERLEIQREEEFIAISKKKVAAKKKFKKFHKGGFDYDKDEREVGFELDLD